MRQLLRGPRTRRHSAAKRGQHLARRRVLGGLTAVAGGALVTGMSAGPSRAASRGPVRSVLEERRDRVVIQDFDISCGAAALCTILRYQHGENLTEREVALGLIQREEYINNPDLVRIRQGFSLLDLKRFVEARGYEGVGFGQLEFENLVDYEPLIVPVNFKDYNHFVVYRGHWGEQVLLADPAYGNRTMGIEQFTRAWIEYPELGKLGFVVNRRDGLIPPNQLAPRARDFLLAQ